MMSLAVTGFVLGWSVAWPPGPINAEAIRRGLARRLWPAYAVVLGGCVGDALWALLVGFGAGALLRFADLQNVLGAVSVGLLLVLSGLFLRGAWRRYADHRAGVQSRPQSAFDGSRGSFALGFTLAITGPWNLAFWLAVIGQADGATHGLAGSLVIASGVLLGAATWGIVLCVGVARLGSRFARPSWEIATQLATGLLMIFFAIRTAARLTGV
jgi:threonine/homoserine/homoserine lactone efflux protein